MDLNTLSPAPQAGTGLHEWILATSRQLVLDGWSREAVLQAMLEAATGKGRRVDREVSDAIDGAIRWRENHPGAVFFKHQIGNNRNNFCYDYMGTGRLDRRDNRPGHVEVDQRKIAMALKQEIVVGFDYHADEFDWWALLGGFNYNMCFCVNVERPKVCKFCDWLDSGLLSRLQFMIPSPMLACGKGGAYKCDRNTAKRLYLVVEFDRGSLEDQFKLFRWLEGDEWRLALAVYSGGKSLHGWFPSYDKNERAIRTFFREATSLGADRQMLIPSQYCRVPNGWNYKHKRRQQVVYWNEEVIDKQNKLIEAEL
jgi:hypothetical protein